MNHSFRYILRSSNDLDRLSVLFYDRFEGLIAESGGRLIAQVDVEVDPGEATDACRRTAGQLELTLGVPVQEIDLDLVDIPEIAERIGRTRQNVQQLATGVRGPGNFPCPLGAPGGIRIWDWAAVAEWFIATGIAEVFDIGLPRDGVARVNAWLATRDAPTMHLVDQLITEMAIVTRRVSDLTEQDLDRVLPALVPLCKAAFERPVPAAPTAPSTERAQEHLVPVTFDEKASAVVRAATAVSEHPSAAPRRRARRRPESPALDSTTLEMLVGT
jgi:hypothetical protein